MSRRASIPRKIRLLLSTVFTFILFSGFVLHVQATNSPLSFVSVKPTVNGTVGTTTSMADGGTLHTSATANIAVAGQINSSINVTRISYSATDSAASASVNIINNGSGWTSNVIVASSSFTITYTPYNGLTYLAPISFNVVVDSNSDTQPISTNCTVSGTIKNKNTNNPIPGANVWVTAANSITQIVTSGITGKYATNASSPFVTYIGSSVTATAYANGYSIVNNYTAKTATGSPCVLNFDDIKLTPTAGGSAGANSDDCSSKTIPLVLSGLTVSSTTRATIPGVAVTLTASGCPNGVSKTVYSDSGGNYNFNGVAVLKGTNISLSATAANYYNPTTSPSILPAVPVTGIFSKIDVKSSVNTSFYNNSI